VRAVAGNAEDVTVTVNGGSDTVVMPPGTIALVVTTEAATVVGFFLAQTAVVSTLLDLSDFPASYATHGGKVVAVKADVSGVEFIALPAPGSGAEELNDLTDVTSSGPEQGQVLAWDEGSSAYINVDNVAVSSVVDLNGLNDAEVASPAQGEALVYDAASSKFKNAVISGSFVGVSPSIKTADYTLDIDDTQALILLEDCDLTVPAHADVALPVGTTVAVSQWGAVASLVVAAAGVTINSADTLTFAKRYAGGSLVKVLTNTWLFTAYTTEV